VVLPKFDPVEAVRLVEKHRVTGTVWVPTMIERVIAHDLSGRDLSSLRRIAYAGAPMAPGRIRTANDVLDGRLVQFYGMVETIPPLTVLTQKDLEEHRPHARVGRRAVRALAWGWTSSAMTPAPWRPATCASSSAAAST
jgi:acyl-CoA synthetase (AMP-forming)/AMP-acid ligase II